MKLQSLIDVPGTTLSPTLGMVQTARQDVGMSGAFGGGRLRDARRAVPTLDLPAPKPIANLACVPPPLVQRSP